MNKNEAKVHYEFMLSYRFTYTFLNMLSTLKVQICTSSLLIKLSSFIFYKATYHNYILLALTKLKFMIDKNFVYLSWRQDNLKNRLCFKNDNKASVQTVTTIGPYKNVYSSQVFDKNAVYQWEIKIEKGSYFKIGVLKQSQIGNAKIRAFSDSKDGYAYFSPGKLRNGTNKDGAGLIEPTTKGYGPGDTVKIKFDTIQGKLSFAVNGDEFKQPQFIDQKFKKGGFVAAVASLHEGSLYSLTLPILQD